MNAMACSTSKQIGAEAGIVNLAAQALNVTKQLSFDKLQPLQCNKESFLIHLRRVQFSLQTHDAAKKGCDRCMRLPLISSCIGQSRTGTHARTVAGRARML